MDLKVKNNTVEQLELDSTDLSADQIRMVKSINSMLSHVLSTKSEREFFTSSSDLLRLVAIAIKKANFNKDQKDTGIDYEHQVLEFCADTLIDEIHTGKLVRLDN